MRIFWLHKGAGEERKGDVSKNEKKAVGNKMENKIKAEKRKERRKERRKKRKEKKLKKKGKAKKQKTVKGNKKGNGKNKKMKHQQKKKKIGKKKDMKKRKGRKGRRRKIRNRQFSSRQDDSTCKDVVCLNNLLQVLKVNKDTVTNFFKQKNRMDRRMGVITNKLNKSNKTNTSMTSLASSLGGSTAVASRSPICSGTYNSTTGNEVTQSHDVGCDVDWIIFAGTEYLHQLVLLLHQHQAGLQLLSVF